MQWVVVSMSNDISISISISIVSNTLELQDKSSHVILTWQLPWGI